MAMNKYRVRLQPTERQELLGKGQRGKTAAKTIQKTQVFLASYEALARQSEAHLATTYHPSERSIVRIRKDFCQRHGRI